MSLSLKLYNLITYYLYGVGAGSSYQYRHFQSEKAMMIQYYEVSTCYIRQYMTGYKYTCFH